MHLLGGLCFCSLEIISNRWLSFKRFAFFVGVGVMPIMYHFIINVQALCCNIFVKCVLLPPCTSSTILPIVRQYTYDHFLRNSWYKDYKFAVSDKFAARTQILCANLRKWLLYVYIFCIQLVLTICYYIIYFHLIKTYYLSFVRWSYIFMIDLINCMSSYINHLWFT